MFKRVLSAFLCVLLLLSCLSCAPKAQKSFNKNTKQFFEMYESEQSVGKAKKVSEYSENGSFAYVYPQTGNEQLDKQIVEYCENLKSDFTSRMSSENDTLFISYKSYSPTENVIGVQMFAKMSLGENVTETSQCFNTGINVTDDFKKLAAICAREQYPEITKHSFKDFLIKNDCVEVVFEQGTATIQFNDLRPFVPEALVTASGRFVDVTKKMVALTFDDGPHNTYSNQILDTLEKHNSVATFFEVGNLVAQGADTIKRADAMGCEIASHTWSHGNLQTLSKDKILSQIGDADEAFEKVLGKKPRLLRPPYGAVGKTLLSNTDKYLIGWSVDTNDWKYRDKNKVVSSVKNEGDLDGDVILMHSLYKSTAQAVEELVPWLIEQGYQLVTVSELVKYKYEDTLKEGKYYAYNYFDYEK